MLNLRSVESSHGAAKLDGFIGLQALGQGRELVGF